MVVTGEKLDRSLQESQTSVTGYGAEEIARSTDTSLIDLFQRTPNTFSSREAFSIRGITNTGLAGTTGEDLATVFVDNAPQDSRALQNTGIPLWDVAQVEILRGPQSTSQGQNTLAGAVVIKTNDPTFHWEGRTRATVGENNTWQTSAAFGGPIVPDLLAFRFSVDRQTSDGAVTNVTRGEDDWDRTDLTTYRGKLLFQPAGNDQFSALLTYSYTDSKSADRAYSAGETLDEILQRQSFDNTRNDFSVSNEYASLEMNYKPSEAWKITSVTAWSRYRVDSLYDADRTAGQNLTYDYQQTDRRMSQELRALGTGDTWRLLAGLYAADTKKDFDASGLTSYPISFLPPPNNTALALFESDIDSKRTNFAAFIDGDWKPLQKLTFLAGLRYDHQHFENDSRQTVSLAQGFPGVFVAPGVSLDSVIGQIVSAANASPSGTQDFDTLLPKIGAVYHWTDTVSTGVTVSRGYRSGGVSFNLGRGAVVPFDPEFTWNYEFAFRSQWLDQRITANANVYYVDWTDQQVNISIDPANSYDSQTANAGSSTLYGFEIEFNEDICEGLNLFQNLGYTHSEFDEFKNSAGDFSGNTFPNAPEWTFSFGASYQHWTGLFTTASFSYIGSSESGAENDPRLRQTIRRLVNAKAGWQNDYFSVYVFGTNLLDDEYLMLRFESSTGVQGAIVGQPRVVGIGVEARF